jgi:hypothetical protein
MRRKNQLSSLNERRRGKSLPERIKEGIQDMSYLSLGSSLNERRWRKSLPKIFKGGGCICP